MLRCRNLVNKVSTYLDFAGLLTVEQVVAPRGSGKLKAMGDWPTRTALHFSCLGGGCPVEPVDAVASRAVHSTLKVQHRAITSVDFAYAVHDLCRAARTEDAVHLLVRVSRTGYHQSHSKAPRPVSLPARCAKLPARNPFLPKSLPVPLVVCPAGPLVPFPRF